MKAPGTSPAWSTLGKWPSRGTFLLRKFVIGFRVSAEPHLDATALGYFHDVLTKTTHYLEYGSGGSTLAAWQTATTVVTVDNDRRFLRAVIKSLNKATTKPARSSMLHVNTGMTKRWGVPLVTAPTPRRLRRWRHYAAAPWAFLDANAIQPDTILVDGRFRVACVLESLLHLRDGSACQLLVDDYVDRHDYAVVEAFADRVATHGRMVVLRKKADFDRAECLRVLPHFQCDWR